MEEKLIHIHKATCFYPIGIFLHLAFHRLLIEMFAALCNGRAREPYIGPSAIAGLIIFGFQLIG